MIKFLQQLIKDALVNSRRLSVHIHHRVWAPLQILAVPGQVLVGTEFHLWYWTF